ncbi:MAG TPA: hypothetical protein VGI13_02080 [Candidatus Acidoferrum sp.]|jgi:hypothetical protein
MKRTILYMVSAGVLLLAAAEIRAQDLLVPAGTLLQCTLDEPNFSSATASVGDPVLCHLRSFQEFGRTVFPRGSMLAGHLEADKEPGHFVGKGYLKITFDRVIVPTGDVPLPAKVIQAKGYKVDKEGDIKGKGHPKRDVAEWMLPPLWPWKVLTLPARGPRPALKGEEPMELRLMDDIVVPQAVAHSLQGSNRPPYASRPSSFVQPTNPQGIQPAGLKVSDVTGGASVANVASAPDAAVANGETTRFTILMLKSGQVYEATKYRVDGGVLMYRLLDGTQGAVNTSDVDWRKTTEMTANVRSVDLPAVTSQTH